MTPSKKSQLQMMESTVIMFVFFVFLAFGFIFFTQSFFEGVKEAQREGSQLDHIQVAQRVLTLPEIQCTKNGEAIANCFDVQKLGAAYTEDASSSGVMEENIGDYFPLFYYSTIKIEEIFPDVPPDSWMIYDNQPNEYQRSSTIGLPAIVYNATDEDSFCEGSLGRGSCAFGWLTVTVYS
ncbi:TPA: hypothetical protein HA361_02605 [Candidatus Woesearchaeota archaeon]|nr:hypothetical protein [Candidatus Woesearchaeota archaeon]